MKNKIATKLIFVIILAVLAGLIFGTGFWLYKKAQNVSESAVESIK